MKFEFEIEIIQINQSLLLELDLQHFFLTFIQVLGDCLPDEISFFLYFAQLS